MGATRKVSIYSEGIGSDCKILNEHGEVVEGIYSANVVIESGSVVTVELILKAPAVSIQNASVTNVELSCNLCGGVEEHNCS